MVNGPDDVYVERKGQIGRAWWRMHEKRRFASSLVGANRPIMHTSWGTHREGQRWGRDYLQSSGQC
jgi:hypothetical protein